MLEARRFPCPHCPISNHKHLLLDDGSKVDYHTASFNKWDDLLVQLRHKHPLLVHPCGECVSQWKRHLRRHPETNPCAYCGFVLASDTNLKTHMLLAHSDRLTQCHHCDHELTSKGCLWEHLSHSTRMRRPRWQPTWTTKST